MSVSSKKSAHPKTLPLAWLWFCFDVPADWECVSYSMNPDKGHLELHTREGFRAQISWLRCKGMPDEERIISDYHRKQLATEDPQAAQDAEVHFRRMGSFKFGFDSDKRPCHASYFLKEENILIQWLFPACDGEYITAVIDPLLRSFTPNTGDELHWALFGCSFFMPNDLKISSARPVPANVQMNFERADHLKVETHRWGMTDALLDGRSLREFTQEMEKAKGRRVLASEDIIVGGHKGARVEFTQRGEYAMEKLTGRWWEGFAVVWLVPEEKRLYALSQIGPPKAERLEVDNVFKFA